MIIKTLLTLLIGSSLYAGGTATTETTFNNDKKFVKIDKHGNSLYTQSVTITTKDYKVDNFWKKFSFDGKGQDKMNFNTISKTGTVQVSVEATSLCSLYPELDESGCSGQKPFFINSKAVPSNYNDTVSLAFRSTPTISDYNSSDNFAFYPLDIDRNEKYYITKTHLTHTSFPTIFGKLFGGFFADNSFFSRFFNRTLVTTTETNTTDIRQRYIANILSGVDQEHLMLKESSLSTTTLNAPVSLINYKEVDTTSASGSCNMMFLTFPADNMFCNFMDSMPFISIFFSQSPATATTITTDTIVSDTETAIIAFAGSFVKENVENYNTKVQTNFDNNNDINADSSLLTKVICAFKGCEKQSVVAIYDNHYDFPNDSGIAMTFAVVDDGGDKVLNFETFRLLGVHSVASQAEGCLVKKSGWFSSSTISINPDTVQKCSEGGFMFMGYSYCDIEADVTNSSKWDDKYKDMKPREWLNWCDDNDDGKYHSIGWSSFKVEENAQETNGGLVLDLKRIKLDTASTGVKLRYKLIDTK